MKLRLRGLDTDKVDFRAWFLMMLSVSNLCRAVAMMFDVAFRNELRVRHVSDQIHTKSHSSKHWFDHLAQGIPTLLWISTLSLLLLFLMEVYYVSQLQSMPLLRPTFAFLNLVLYVMYGAISCVTLQDRAYQAYKDYAFFLLGCVHILISLPLIWYGRGLTRQFRSRTLVHPALGPTQSVCMHLVDRISFVCRMTSAAELFRGVNDLSYSFDLLPNVLASVDLETWMALVKLGAEWAPSAILLYSFRPIPITQESTPQKRFPTADSFIDPLIFTSGNQRDSSTILHFEHNT